MSAACIDEHHRLCRYLPPGPDWMADGMEGLCQDFLIDDLRKVTSGAGVTGTIVIESARAVEITSRLNS
jgi:hypothetical protein